MKLAPLHLPSRTMDIETYRAVCRYLALVPDDRLYARVCRTLTRGGAGLRPNWLDYIVPWPWELPLLDAFSRLADPAGGWRRRFNAVIAVHECCPGGVTALRGGYGYRALIRLGWETLIYGCALASAPVWALGRRLAACGGPDLSGATVLVTGAAGEVGRAVVGRLLDAGARVLAHARNVDSAAALREGAGLAGMDERLIVVPADLESPGELLRSLSRKGEAPDAIDAVIAVAGRKPAEGETAERAMRAAFAVNVHSVSEIYSWVRPAWRARGRGSFVLVSSLGRYHGMMRTGAYNASKAAVSMLAESWAAEELSAHSRLAVVVIEPGLLRSSMAPTKGLSALLSVGCDRAAAECVKALGRGASGTVRFPGWFYLLSLGISLTPDRIRHRVIAALDGTRRS